MLLPKLAPKSIVIYICLRYKTICTHMNGSLFTEYIENAKQRLKAAASEVAENYVYKKRPQLEPSKSTNMFLT